MHRRLSLVALACAMAACSGDEAPDASKTPPLATPVEVAPAREGQVDTRPATRLTIYSGDYEQLANAGPPQPGMPGYALVSRPLHYNLVAGRNVISATGTPRTMDIEAALLRSPAAEVTIESQSYVAALTSSEDVLSQVIGQRVTVEHTSGNTKQTDSGILLAAGQGLTLALGDGRIKLIRDYDNFSVVGGTNLLPQEAMLKWTVNVSNAGDAAFELSYPMGGLAWRAEYTATLSDAKACQLALDGAALVANRSGVTFNDALLTLVAGEPNRVQAQPSGAYRNYAAADAASAAPAPPSERISGEYRAYELPGSIRIDHGDVERVALFPRRIDIACERVYLVEADSPEWQPPRPMLAPDYRGATGKLPVKSTVSLHNTKQAGLGRALPAGRVRVFDGDDLLGESRLEHTATGADIELEVGTAFDLRAEREITDFALDRSGRTMTESVAVTLGNAKQQDVRVRLVEPLPRWTDWEILESSVPSEKKDARHASFEVPVPAGGETRLTYTVRYRWAEDVKP